jgi:transcriptional regulator with XRE-family HTH domain
MAKKPYQDTRLARFIDNRLLELKHKKTQTEIAEEAGFVYPNMVTMIKQGSTKLPIDRVPALAKALESDPALLLRLALEQSEGSTATAAIYEIIGQPITKNEMSWIREIREASGDTDPRLTSRAGAAIRGVFGK